MMTTTLAGLLTLVLILNLAKPTAANEWWDENWRYSVPVDVGVRHFDRERYPVEAAVDFQALLEKAGIPGKFDKYSVQVVECDRNGQTVRETPSAYHVDFNPRLNRTEGYVSWFIDAEAGEKKYYQIYFDTEKKGRENTGKRPAENIVANPGFEDESPDGLPENWSVSHPRLFALSDLPYSSGKQALKVYISEENIDPKITTLSLSQKIDVSGMGGQPVLFKCDLYLASGRPGVPCSIELRQFREDGSEIPERIVQPRWLTIELAEGQLVQFYERGCLSHEAHSLEIYATIKWRVVDADTRAIVRGEAQYFELFVDNMVIRPGERLPIPYENKVCYVPGRLENAPLNKGLELVDERRFAFNSRPAAAISVNKHPGEKSLHWGIRKGTVEMWVKPYWDFDDGKQHVFFTGGFYSVSVQCRLIKTSGNRLTFIIADSKKTQHKISAEVKFKKDQWRHVACAWDFDEPAIGMFVDGKQVAQSEPEDAPWPSNADTKESARKYGKEDEPTMPLMITVGNEGGKNPNKSLSGVVDELRVSDCVRYAADFVPESVEEFLPDENTRALFHFEEYKHGIHHGDDRFAQGFLFQPEHPRLEHITLCTLSEDRNIIINPRPDENLFDKNCAENNMAVSRQQVVFPDARKVEYTHRSFQKLIDSDEDTFAIEVGGDHEPINLSVTFEPLSDKLMDPKIVADGMVDPFSYETLRNTYDMDGLSDKEKAVKVMALAVDKTNYYDDPAYETINGRERRVSYSFIKHLNMYPLDQCGPLNHFLRKLFLVYGLSSNQFAGTGHSFQQVFYNGSWHVFDLSSRKYFLDRDDETFLPLSGIEEDPYAMDRNEGGTYHYLPARMSGRSYSSRTRYHSMSVSLRNAEKLRLCWYNEGKWLDIGADRKPNTSVFHSMSVAPPQYSNGKIIFSPGASERDFDVAENVVLSEGCFQPGQAGKPSYLIYKLNSPYISVGGSIQADVNIPTDGCSIAVSVSFDAGENWSELWRSDKPENPTGGFGRIDLDISNEVKGRYEYWLKVDMNMTSGAVKIDNIRVDTDILLAPLSLPGRLKLGRNILRYTGKPAGSPAKVTYRWIERRDTDLAVSLNGISYYCMEGRARVNLFAANPGQKIPVTAALSGIETQGEVSIENVPDGWQVTPESRDFKLSEAHDTARVSFEISTPEVEQTASLFIHTFDLVVRADSTIRKIQAHVLLAPCPLAREAEKADEITGEVEIVEGQNISGGKCIIMNGDGSARYNFETAEEGEYTLWARALWPSSGADSFYVSVDDGKKLVLDREGECIFVHHGGQYGFWQWYRLPGINIGAGKHQLIVSKKEPGAQLDAIVLIRSSEVIDKKTAHIFQNWYYKPWEADSEL